MGYKTAIEWADATWNPVYGCSMAKGSEAKGCLNCYAAALHARNLPGMVAITGKPLARFLPSGPRWTGVVGLDPRKLHLPAAWKKPQRVFVNSLSDLFHESLPILDIDAVLDAASEASWHRYLILTKRPRNLLGYSICAPMTTSSHLWFGVSVEDQATADLRLPQLAEARVRKRFVSYEPALGPIDFTPYLTGPGSLDWGIIGGESGAHARSMDVAWVHSTIRQFRAAGKPLFVKQLGAVPIYGDTFLMSGDPKGGRPDSWPETLRIRELPDELAAIVENRVKKGDAAA